MLLVGAHLRENIYVFLWSVTLFTSNNARSRNMRPQAYVSPPPPPTGRYGGCFHQLCIALESSSTSREILLLRVKCFDTEQQQGWLQFITEESAGLATLLTRPQSLRAGRMTKDQDQDHKSQDSRPRPRPKNLVLEQDQDLTSLGSGSRIAHSEQSTIVSIELYTLMVVSAVVGDLDQSQRDVQCVNYYKH